MRSTDEVHRVFRLAADGLTQAEIARQVGVARATVRDWLSAGEQAVLSRPMRVRRQRARDPCPEPCPTSVGLDEPAYAYLLGQYLGDGCISTIGTSSRLRLACCDAYPGIMAEAVDAISRVLPGARVGKIARVGCTEVYATWPHWPCLFPHGPGVKHRRPIVLAGWQRAIALDRHPDRLLRGLIHSDGCRCINRVRSGGRTYEYTRYLFTNLSPDIQHLYLDACARLGIDARPNSAVSISVARRAAVARLDEIVGPKT
jgi:Homeodomain-like domain